MKKQSSIPPAAVQVTLLDISNKQFLKSFSKAEVDFIQNEIKNKKISSLFSISETVAFITS